MNRTLFSGARGASSRRTPTDPRAARPRRRWNADRSGRWTAARALCVFRLSILTVILLPPLSVSAAAASAIGERLAAQTSALDPATVPGGTLLDRMLELVPLAPLDGSAEAPALTAAQWRQVYHQVRGSRMDGSAWPATEELRRRAARRDEAIVPLALLDIQAARLRPDALESGALRTAGGRLVAGAGDPYAPARVTSFAPLFGHTYHGGEVSFRLDAGLLFTDEELLPGSIEIDFEDGQGWIGLEPGRIATVRYDATGPRTIRLRRAAADGSLRHAAGLFEVRSLRAPAPHDTLHVTATIPYAGGLGSGEAYVYLAEGHSTLTEPAVVIEGFDLDNSMNWDELYDLLNRQNLIEDLRADGFDAVVLNFDDSVDYLQRNAFVAVELIQQVRALVGPERSLALAGASMGGLIGRYALAWMEANSQPHGVRTFVSFDSPQNGANIPLGIQYWLWFFADQSAEAAALLAALDTPGARQLLAYHHTDPPGSTGQGDPLRGQFLVDLAGLGDWPVGPRLVAVANGSAARQNQGFAPAAQIIRWEYFSFLVDIIGNVWAVPDGTSQRIFQGEINFILLPSDNLDVTVSATRPYDSAPGGWRDSMAEMDAVEAPYGDIEALHPNHAFIPTVSALAIDTNDLLYDIANDPDLLAHTPFDAVYFPTGGENQEHVDITAENAAWLRAEISSGVTTTVEPVAGLVRTPARVEAIYPNPAGAAATIRFTIPPAGRARLLLFDAVGRRIESTGWSGSTFTEGTHAVTWDPVDQRGRRLAAGLYLLSLQGEGWAATNKVVLR